MLADRAYGGQSIRNGMYADQHPRLVHRDGVAREPGGEAG